MATVSMCSMMCYKDHSLLNPKEVRENVKHSQFGFIAIQENCGCLPLVSSGSSRPVVNNSTGTLSKFSTRKNARVSQGIICSRGFLTSKTMTKPFLQPNMHMVLGHLRFWSSKAPQQQKSPILCHAFKSGLNQKQLELLDAYFGKLKQDANQPSPASFNKKEEIIEQSGSFKAKEVLGSLEGYFGKVDKDAKSKNYLPPASHGETTEAASPYSVREDSGRAGWKKLKRYMNFQKKDSEGGQKSSGNEISDMYLMSMLVSINIAVFLFEIASPIRHSDVELFSLPSLYGAKINHLILLGEWWRLVTPMFLHSGILHIAFGCWVLLTFGPRVCRGYGSFTFLLIYILGGISGNLTSYLQTPEPTVGGTGPVFALIGAWLIYQIQNKNVITKDDSEDMFQKAVIATTCSFVLGNFGPIDDWTHFGALFIGMIYGFLTCPILQMGDRSSESRQDERITLFGQYADPCKSVMIFSLFVLVLSSLLFIMEPPLNSLPVGSLLWLY